VTPKTAAFLLPLALAFASDASAQSSLRFHGTGAGDVDRVKIRIDDPATAAPGPPADVGATDFTIELFLRATAAENSAPAVACGPGIDWIFGNIVLDRDRYNQDRKFGVSIAGGVVVFGVSGDGTGDLAICGATDVLDGAWHHVALTRRRADGRLAIFVDGALDAEGDGPDGDVSYPDDGVPGDFCGGPCVNSDPFIVLGAEKHDAGPAYPSFAGHLDELRISNVLRYASSFAPPAAPFAPDASTTALYHFDEGTGDVVGDSSGAAGGPSEGERRFGGSPAGPEWSSETPFPADPFACRLGNVNAGAGAVADVLFVNGSAGDPRCRRVAVTAGVPTAVAVAAAPAGGTRQFALWYFDGEPSNADATLARFRNGSNRIVSLGVGARALPCANTVQPGSCPCPTRFATGFSSASFGPAKASRLCLAPNSPVPRAPTTIPTVFPLGLFTIGGLVSDAGSAGDRPISVTNWVVVESR